MPDVSGVWQTWCGIITNETVVMQEAATLKVTSENFHKAWSGMKSKADTLDPAGWMRATAVRKGYIRNWQLFFEDCPVVLAPTTVRPTPGPREDTVSEIFWNDIRFISAINVLGLPGAVVPVTLARWQADRRPGDRRPLSRRPHARCSGDDRKAGRHASVSALGANGLSKPPAVLQKSSIAGGRAMWMMP